MGIHREVSEFIDHGLQTGLRQHRLSAVESGWMAVRLRFGAPRSVRFGAVFQVVCV